MNHSWKMSQYYLLVVFVLWDVIGTLNSDSNFFVLADNAFPLSASLSSNTEVAGLAGQSVLLPCHLSPACGSIHSIKWYRADRRVYIFSEIAEISRAEDDLSDRAKLKLQTNSTLAQLEISPLMTADEDLYKCEVTYLEAKEHCALLQSIKLNTFAKPEYVRIEDMKGSETANASLIGPFNEGNVITLVCMSGGGKPVAHLNWYNSSSPLPGQYRNMTEDDGTGIGRSQLTVTLGRGDLGAKLECSASSPTLDVPMSAWVEVDVYVRPHKWELTGYDGPVLDGTVVNLLCRVKGARPAASITFFNGTDVISPQPPSNLAVQHDYTIESEIIEADGTYETQSRMIFTANRYDNGVTITCQTTNQVMESMGEIPYVTSVKLQVNYAPVVDVTPANVTVNETSDILIFCEVDANPPELISVRWYRNGDLLDVNDLANYEGGNIQQPSLLVKAVAREDLGVYYCVVQNQVGQTQSKSMSYINVLYKPHVSLGMEPATPVKEQEERNVTLACDVESGNPAILDAVRWYLDGDLLKELPECPNITTSAPGRDVETAADLCDIDPSKLLLETVGRSFQGNYTCQGLNDAGWGPHSPPVELHVHYPPGPAKLEFEPLLVVKGQALTMQCIVEELGRPEAKVFRWMRGTHVQPDVRSMNWTAYSVSLEHRANFSCQAVNEAGLSPPATVNIDVFAPPTFIGRLQPYMGVLTTSKEVFLSCHVECFPLCEIVWLKNGLPIGETELYSIKTTTLPPDQTKSDFESVLSTLFWNLTAWPNGQLDRQLDNANYTCQSTSNSVGAGVSSTTHFHVEYPPEQITLSSPMIDVVENEIPDKVTCSSKAFPEASYFWKYGTENVSNGAVLFFNTQFTRKMGGDYECVAYNKHGNVSTKAKFNVQYIPECTISPKEVDDEMMLVCEVESNPAQVDFAWMLDNSTYLEKVQSKGLSSSITLIASPEFFGKYKCFANNSIGMSAPCERVISAGSWIRKLSDDKIIIIAAVVGIAIVLFLIACIIIILVCRRRRMSEKLRLAVINLVADQHARPEERQNPDGKDVSTSTLGAGNNNNTRTSPPPPPPPKPPTTPPVDPEGDNSTNQSKWPVKPGVHLHVNGLHSLGKIVKPINGFSYGTKHSTSTLPTNLSNSAPHLISSQETSDTPVSTTTLTRKRKRPSKDPSPAHRKGGDLHDDNSKAFYENLPFHGLASPQSKPAEIRPPSELSHTGSSGYGSTRSQREKAALATGNDGGGPQKSTMGSLTKPVSIVKPSKEQKRAISPIASKSTSNGPKTSTPNSDSTTTDLMNSFSYISETCGSSSNLVVANAALLDIPSSISTFPKRSKKPVGVDAIFNARLTKTESNTNIRLATVKPQRIASVSGGSLRPYRLPEASRILFRSVRGKYGIRGWPSLPEVVLAPGLSNSGILTSVDDVSKSSPDSAAWFEKQPASSIKSDLSSGSSGGGGGRNLRGSGVGCSTASNQEQQNLNHSSESDPAEDSKLEAITIANTIANKNANKIIGPRPNHHPEQKGVFLTKPTISSKPTSPSSSSINSIMTSIKPTSFDLRKSTNSNPIVPTCPTFTTTATLPTTATIVGSSRKNSLGKEIAVACEKKGSNLAKYPPPLIGIGNAIIPPPPSSLDDDEDEEEHEENGTSSNDDNNNSATNDQACLTVKAKFKSAVPMAAPRIQTKSKGIYQNIPFTKKTPRHETLLTPLSLQYQHQNPNHLTNHQSHTLAGNHLSQHQLQQLSVAPHSHSGLINQQQSSHPNQYATTHRTFPSNVQADLFSSLNRKGPRPVGPPFSKADIMDMTGNGSNRRTANGGAPPLWHADLIYGHIPNGRGSAGNNGHMMSSNGQMPHNGYIPNGMRNGNSTIVGTVHPNNNSGTQPFPMMRGGEINV
ncbi:uncharacterized protein LOC110843952 isoform X2 [Folsomia candida]|uniref:uncharacterized protein LOC110843952 isoform X2 n=1 Tax=Folsomia candida TaxID=158441 RepID=UPI001605503B|nr:uncharacterized protein LOC110843952 isoform X2 [Folsomia candida]